MLKGRKPFHENQTLGEESEDAVTYRTLLTQLRNEFPQPISDAVHDSYVVFSILRAIDQVDALKSKSPILGQPLAPDYLSAQSETLPEQSGSTEEVVAQLVKYLEGMFIWGHPQSQLNVITQPSIASVIGVLLPSLYNPNLCSDESARRVAEVEVRVSAMSAELVGYDPKMSGGVFTFGGTGTLLYAAKVGLEKACPNSLQQGVTEQAIILASQTSHYACYSVAAWLGIGQRNVVAIPSKSDNSIDIAELGRIARDQLSQGKKIAAMVATMGSTDAFALDDIKSMRELRDQLVDEFDLDYTPHLHADAVIGWAWSVFNDYEFDKNPLGFRGRTLRSLAEARHHISNLHLADSIGFDFHKTGYVPYISSLVLFRDQHDFKLITRDDESMPYVFQSGEYHPGKFTLETSRSATGPMAALANFLLLGKQGLRTLLGHSVEMAEVLREKILSRPNLTVMNRENVGAVTLFRAYPDGVDTFITKDRELHDVNYKQELLEHNQYNRDIYQIVHADAIKGKGVAISLTDCYCHTDYGEPVVALKSYVLSPFSDETQMHCVVEHVDHAREELAQRQN